MLEAKIVKLENHPDSFLWLLVASIIEYRYRASVDIVLEHLKIFYRQLDQYFEFFDILYLIELNTYDND